MGSEVLPDPGSAFGERVRARLREEQVIWFTTTAADGTPQPNPVWFVFEDPSTILVYNRSGAHRLSHIGRRPQVALHFDGNGHGGDIVVLTGRAKLAEDMPPPHGHAAYLAKYGAAMARVSGAPHEFSIAYPVAVHVEITLVRGF